MRGSIRAKAGRHGRGRRNLGPSLQPRHDEHGPLCPRRRMHDGRCGGTHSKWRLRKFFSKAYGMAAASLLEAEIVTADGAVRVANACTHPDLFWALKGGGGGSFGVVTRLTLRTHSLPESFGAVFATIKATSDAAFRSLIGRVLGFYTESLFNPHWGEQIVLRPGNVLAIAMVFQGLTQLQAETTWRPFFEWLRGSPQDFAIVSAPPIAAVPARHFWDPA